jgi:heme/copper-type cytochrome/quinol oxidase subunit 2
MTMYWIYDIPNWTLALLTITTFVVLSLAGLFVTRRWTQQDYENAAERNDLVNFFFAAVGVLYGLALGLIAVATWDDFKEVDSQVSQEAAAITALYHDLEQFPPPRNEVLQNLLRDYTRTVIDQEWPAHPRGQIIDDGAAFLDQLEDTMMAFNPTRETERTAQAVAMRSLDTLNA